MINLKLAKGHRLITIPAFILLLLSFLWLIMKIKSNIESSFDILLLLVSISIFIFVFQFFRDPIRIPESDSEYDILSPADGILFEVDTTSEEKVTIFRIRMRFWDVHVNYMPFKGKLVKLFKKRGLLGIPIPILPGLNRYSKNKNARQTMEFISDKGFSFKIVQISGILAYRTVSYLKIGDLVERGWKIGMIRFGSETDLYVPSPLIDKIIVIPGKKVIAGKTTIATFK